MVGITTGMKQLQRYLATGLVHRLGQGAVTLQVAGVAELIAVELRTPAQGRRGAAADDERHLLLGPEPIKGGQPLDAMGVGQESRLHRPHDHPVWQTGGSQIQRGEQVGVVGHGDSDKPDEPLEDSEPSGVRQKPLPHSWSRSHPWYFFDRAP